MITKNEKKVLFRAVKARNKAFSECLEKAHTASQQDIHHQSLYSGIIEIWNPYEEKKKKLCDVIDKLSTEIAWRSDATWMVFKEREILAWKEIVRVIEKYEKKGRA